MKEELKRIFFGEFSWAFLLELTFRTTVMYLYALGLVRLLGKRGLGALAPFELTVIIALGSALGDPMLMRDVPLSHGMLVVTVVVLLQRLLVHLTERYRDIELMVQSTSQRLVKDGLIDLKALHEEGFSREDLFLSLRKAGIEHLGQVKKAFLETTGEVSVWKFQGAQIRSGLSVLPESDNDCPEPFRERGKSGVSRSISCDTCGFTEQAFETTSPKPCVICGRTQWVLSSSEGVITS